MLMFFRKSVAQPPQERGESIADLLAWCGAGGRSETFVRDAAAKSARQVSASDHLYFAARLVAAPPATTTKPEPGDKGFKGNP